MLHLPGGNVVAPEWAYLDKVLKNGDGINWTGDERMYLQIGVLTNRKTGATGRRLEVWRLNEDGTSAMIGHWHPTEQHRVAYDLANMRIERPGYEDALAKIDAHNERLQTDASEKHSAAIYETLDHAVHLHVAREHGEHQHFLPEKIEPKQPAATETKVETPVASD